MRRFWRSTRFRVALVSAVSSAVALGAVAAWFLVQAQDRLETTAGQMAEQRLIQIEQLLGAGVPVAGLSERLFGVIFEITDMQGNRLASCPAFKGTPSLKPPGPVKGYVDFVVQFEQSSMVRGSPATAQCLNEFGSAADPDRFGRADDSTPIPLHLFTWQSVDKSYMVYVAAPVDERGQAEVDTAMIALLVVVPLVSLLIGVIAWLAVRRSLRPVEAIRSEVAEISAQDLGRRVPVPAGQDEIPRLAETMNTMLARLDTAVARQNQFTADASHELRTPLTAMRNQLEVLLTYPDRIEWRTANENALLDVTRMEDLVADLLLLSKLEGQETDLFPPVALAEVVDACLIGREPREGVVITSGVDRSAVVPGKRARLVRLLRNLVDNAERHAVHQVRVTVSTEDTECVLAVTDDGPGIPEEDRERVFDRFVRLDVGRDRDDGGSGLGLAIVAEITHAHGGTVTADGAQLTVRLPRAES